MSMSDSLALFDITHTNLISSRRQTFSPFSHLNIPLLAGSDLLPHTTDFLRYFELLALFRWSFYHGKDLPVFLFCLRRTSQLLTSLYMLICISIPLPWAVLNINPILTDFTTPIQLRSHSLLPLRSLIHKASSDIQVFKCIDNPRVICRMSESTGPASLKVLPYGNKNRKES